MEYRILKTYRGKNNILRSAPLAALCPCTLTLLREKETDYFTLNLVLAVSLSFSSRGLSKDRIFFKLLPRFLPALSRVSLSLQIEQCLDWVWRLQNSHSLFSLTLCTLDKLCSLSLKHLLTSSSRFETLLLEYTGTDHSKVKKITHFSPVLTLLTDLKSCSFSVYMEKQVAID